MAYLLFPGRHLCFTVGQAALLRGRLGKPIRQASWLQRAGPSSPDASDAPDTLVLAITSSNQSNSRYNPIDFHLRAIGADRFVRALQGEAAAAGGTWGPGGAASLRFRIVGVPHFGQTERFARHTLLEIEEQTEGAVCLTPANTLVLCSTPGVVEQYAALGFGLAAEGEERGPLPIDLVRRAAEAGETWADDRLLAEHLHPSSRSLWLDFPEVPRRITRLYRDPLLNEQGSMTATRNYAAYAWAMSNPAAVEFKYADVKDAIRPGRIVDEGCADGALLVPIARDFPDSDLIGIEITGEFLAQCRERQRRGDFGGTYCHFHQRNLLEDLFEPGSIDTTLCNSTVHELWSFGGQAPTVRAYFVRKIRQARRGGRLVIRDVVGPDDMGRPVLMWLNDADGSNGDPLEEIVDPAALRKHLDGLSTAARFVRFARDFLREMRASGRRAPDTAVAWREETIDGRRCVALPLKHAAEFLAKKDYTASWDSEMNEEFTFWSFADWKRELESAGFHVLPLSRAYTNPWLVDNRFKAKAELYERVGGGLVRVDYPATNLVIVGEKR